MSRVFIALSLVAAAPFALSVGCAKINEAGADGQGGRSGPSGRGGSGGRNMNTPPVTRPPACNGMCADFPTTPILDEGVSGDPAGMFSGTPPTANGPCISEPEDGTLFPNNWLRPRVKFTNPSGRLAQIRMRAKNQTNDLVAYTTKSEWKLPHEIWAGLRGHQTEEDVEVTVWIQGQGASKVKFRTAPVPANGSMVFWGAKPSEVGKLIDQLPVARIVDDSKLFGFAVGDESVVEVLRIDQVKQVSRQQNWTQTREVKCIGCHSATPTGDFVSFVEAWPWNGVIAGVKPGNQGAQLPELQAGGLLALNMPWGGPMTFSAQHWKNGDRIAVLVSSIVNSTMPWSTDNNKPAQLVWYDLESPAPPKTNGMDFPLIGMNYGVIARTGDSRGAAFPNWSHDGSKIVYASTAGGNLDGRLERGATDLYVVPYNNRAGGAATPVPGASKPDMEEYYPAYSPDDKLIAYTAVPSGEKMYANPKAEIWVADPGSGNSARLRANDPPECTGKKSPGINNHWPKWSPEVAAGERTYYWLIFSSNRYDTPPVPTICATTPSMCYPGAPTTPVPVSQLYMAPVLVDEFGITSYPAIYLWNQPSDRLNTTPAWEAFMIPPVE